MEKPASYYIWTIGCQMNKADSERIGSLFEGWGLWLAEDVEAADAIILNSCVVRQKAENRVLSKIGSLAALKKRKPDTAIIVVGCLVDGQVGELRRLYPHVDAFFRPGQFADIAGWGLARGFSGQPGFSLPAACSSPAAYVAIIEGCDNFCTYCIVPYRRGRERSRPAREIVCQVRGLVQRDVKEVTLVGQNVDSYGHDLPDCSDLADLLAELNRIDGLCRLRFLTSHPKDMTLKLVRMISTMEKVCEHVNLPVQSGNDEILLEMKRGYSVAQYRNLIGEIRNCIPNVALSTDVIVGFPGETEDQFTDTYKLLQEIRFDTVHVAAYSPRPGTQAARNLKDDVPAGVKRDRLQKIEALQEKIAGEINSSLLGKRVEVLVEKETGGKWLGRTRTNKLVFFEAPGELTGKLVLVAVNRTSPWSLTGQFGCEAERVAG